MPLVTLKDIAREVGLSDMAVSNALRGRGRMTDQTRARVVEVARRLGYRPNASARSMAQGRFGCIALLLSTEGMFSYLPSQLLDGIEIGLSKPDYHLTVARLPDDKLTNEGFLPKIMREWSADGVLINYQLSIPKRMIDIIRDYRIPSIWINTKGKHDCVYLDDHGAGRIATEHLIAMGHQRITYVDFSHRLADLGVHYSATDRKAGYEAAMSAARLKPDYLFRVAAPDAQDDRLGMARALLSRPKPPTAVVCYSGNNNAAVMMLAAAHLGLDVPTDLSIVAIDVEVAELGKQVTTVRLPMAELGTRAAEAIIDKVQRAKKSVPSQSVPAQLKAASSTVTSPRRP